MRLNDPSVCRVSRGQTATRPIIRQFPTSRTGGQRQSGHRAILPDRQPLARTRNVPGCALRAAELIYLCGPNATRERENIMDFDMLGLAPRLVAKLAEQGITDPTPIQKQAIPHAMNGRDVMGIAQTGTGKTAAFGSAADPRADQGGRETRRENRRRADPGADARVGQADRRQSGRLYPRQPPAGDAGGRRRVDQRAE